jgi:MFS family permease
MGRENELEETARSVDVAIAPAQGPIISEDDPRYEPPYGWVVCIAMHLINAFTWGNMATFGVYLSYYLSNDVFSGASDLDYAFVGGVNFALAMGSAPFVNMATRRFGTHPPMYFGGLCFGGGFIAASFASKLWHLILAQGVLVGLGVGFAWQPATSLLPQWFKRNRSLAQGISAAGSGIGGIIFSFSTTPMIENLSLAWSLRITGIISLVALMAATFMVRDRNETIRPKIKAFDKTLLKKYRVWLLMGYTFFSVLGYVVYIYTLSAFARSLGLSQTQAGIVAGVNNLGTAVGRPFFGVLSDRYGRITVASILTASNTLMTFAVWVPTDSYGLLLFLSLVVGATSGVYWGTIAPLCAEVVELKELPSTLALMWMTVTLPSIFSEVIALEIRRPGSDRPYLWPQIYTGLVFLIASACLVELKRQKWGLMVREKHR